MTKLYRHSEEFVAWMNEQGGTNYTTIYQVCDADAEEGYSSLSEDDGTWIFYHQDRAWEFSSKEEAVKFITREGFELAEE